MAMLKEICSDILSLFYPIVCVCCNKHLTYNEELICVHCRHDLPLTNFTNQKNNPVEKLFYGRIPVFAASSLLFFYKKGITQKLIHQLKYKQKQEIGNFVGHLLSEEISKSKRFANIDCIVPVPIHPKKLNLRGYNQLTRFGKCLSNVLKIPFEEDHLIKTNSSDTQTKKTRIDRWENTNTSFKLIDTTTFENRHVLLIDDVITTGATIEACCNELLKTKNITLSVATIAYTE